jgi:hypothetical protein
MFHDPKLSLLWVPVSLLFDCFGFFCMVVLLVLLLAQLLVR